jgi:iron complex outermembrane receptor protein
MSGVPDQVVGLAVTDDYSLDTHGVELSAGYLALDNLALLRFDESDSHTHQSLSY